MGNNKQDYEMFNNVSLDELKDIIHGATLNALTESYGILSLGDLFTKVDNGVLKQNVLKTPGKSKEQKELYYKKILAIVNILKCKYLNEKPLINENTTIDEFQIKLGLTKNEADKLIELGIKDFSQLLEMEKKDDYSKIYSVPKWGKTKADKLINKIKIIYNYYNKNEKLVIESKETINISEYEKLKSVSLDEVKGFFNKNTFNFLTKYYGILTLGDLFICDYNGELLEKILVDGDKDKRTRYYQKLKATINILKCKYLNENIHLDENTRWEEFDIKLGLSSIDKINLQKFGILNLSSLLNLCFVNDFSILYKIPNFDANEASILVNKIKVIYNYLKSKKDNLQVTPKEPVKESSKNENTSIDKIILLHNELKILNEANRRLTLEINKVTEQINEKKQSSNSGTSLDYETLKNTSLLEVENFFSKQNFHFLISNGFVSLWDIFNKDFYNEMVNNYQYYPYNERKKIISTVKIIRCKYFGDDPFVREVTSYKVFEDKLGISLNTVMFLHYQLCINNVADLLNLFENSQLIKLYYNQIDSTLIHKLLVIEKFLKNRKNNNWQRTNLHSSVVTKISSNSFVVEASLLEQLKKLINDNNGIIRQIELTQNDLDKELEKVKVIKR